MLRSTKLLITPDRRGVASRLAELLRARGIHGVTEAAHEDEVSGAIYLGGLGPLTTEEEARGANREAFMVARSLSNRLSKQPGLFVTVQDTGGDFGRSESGRLQPWAGGLSGLAKAARIEWPHATSRAIDIACGARSADEVAAALVDELIFGGSDVEIGLRRDGSRVSLECVSSELSERGSGAAVGRSSVFLVSGGARGVTAACVSALAVATGARFVLLGRTALLDEAPLTAVHATESAVRQALIAERQVRHERVLPGEIEKSTRGVLAVREIKATLRALKDAGADARYYAADVEDDASITRILDEVRTDWGPITGLIHGAGVVADKRIADKTDEQFDAVFDTKVEGIAALLRATKDDPVDTLVLFSSVVARWGNEGQADYAMANEVLNRLAWSEARRRGPRCRVKAINWGPWSGGMVNAALQAHLQKRDVALISFEEGARRFVDEVLHGATEDVEVLIGDHLKRGIAPSRAAAEARDFDIALDAGAYPALLDHQIQGRPVVPMVLAIRWFERAGSALFQGSRFAMTRVRVLKGIQLDPGAKLTRAYRMRCSVEHDSFRCALLDEQGILRYSALLRSTEEGLMSTTPARAPDVARSHAWRWAARDFYGRELFHGPAFQVIESLGALGADGCSALMRATTDDAWPSLLDGGLQLTCLWALQMAGMRLLPAGVDEVVLGRPPRRDEAIRCSVRVSKTSETAVVADIELFDSDGMRTAVMTNVRMFGMPEAIGKEAI